jgi:nucleoside-diphosphate-sugar epimerase
MLIEIARGNGVKRFVFASSCSVYGATDLVMTEDSMVEPISLYAQTKVDSERALLAAASPDFHPTIVRLATVFGYSHRPRFDLVVNLLVAKAFRDGVITIFNGEQWRPFIHVADVARGMINVLEAPLAVVSGEVFNLGDSRFNYTLTAISEKIRVAFPYSRVENVSNQERRNYRVSFARICQQLGFECTIPLEIGIRELQGVLERGIIVDFMAPEYHNQRFLKNAGALRYSNEIDGRLMAAFSTPVGVAVQAVAAGH